MLLKTDIAKKTALLNTYNIEHVVAKLSGSSQNSQTTRAVAPSASLAATKANAAALISVRQAAARGDSDADIVTAAVTAAKVSARAHGVEDSNDLANIVSTAASSAVATVMANRARAGGNSHAATAKVGQLAKAAAVQSGLSVAKANAMAASKASQAVSETTLEPMLSVGKWWF